MPAMSRVWLLLACVACTAPATAELEDDGPDGKEDGGSSSRFVEVDPSHTNAAFRKYIHRALDKLEANDTEIAALTLLSIKAGHIRIDELADLTCKDFERVRKDLPNLALEPADRDRLHDRDKEVATAIAGEIDGYMWSNRIYVSRGQSAQSLAATFVHETNHVINQSDVGYYTDLPTSGLIHEYRAFHAERMFDPSAYEGVDLVDYVLTEYDLDRTKVKPSVLANPLTPHLLPDEDAWTERRVQDDPVEPIDCDPLRPVGQDGLEVRRVNRAP